LAQYNAQFVGADGGRIIMSLVGDDGHIYVAFTGRCLKCPNQLAATLPQLQSSFPDFTFEVFPWQLPFLQP
jgi:Fe-S cluster biogenesis protein NfuA